MSLRLIVVALLITTAVALGLIAYRATQPVPVVAIGPEQSVTPSGPPMATFIVTARALPAGTLVRDEDFVIKPIAADVVIPGALPGGPDAFASVRGGMIRHYVDAGSTLTAADILRPRDRGYLATVLAPGTRAISIAVDLVTGVAGLIWPGDQVDVILTQEMDPSQAPVSRRIISETVMTNIRIIAVDQDIVQGASAGSAGASVVAGRVAHTVTLQVDTDQAERLTVAQRLGHLALAIRSISDASDQSPGLPAVYGADVSPALSSAGERPAAQVRVIEGDHVAEVAFH